jgi:Rhs element Vgr protein
MATILQPSEGILSFEILIGGSKIKDDVEIIEILTQMEVNRIASATVILADGGAIGLTNAPFKNSEGNDFIPGNEIEIKLGYESKNTSVFKGIILSQRLSIKNGQSQLEINCKDKAIQMTKGRFNTIFENKKDSDAISGIASNYSIQAKVDATNLQLPVLMQYNCSDWDFVVIRAEMNNMMVVTDKNSLVVKKYSGQSTEFEINASQFVIDIDLNLDSENIAGHYITTGWDDTTQKINSETASLSDSINQGNISAKKLSDVAFKGESNFYSSASILKEELQSWGESLANKAVLSKIRGTIKVPGTANIIAGDLVTISGFTNRFNGDAFVSAVIHSVEEGTWTTTLQIGKSPEWHAALPDVQDIKASGLLPAVNGTQIATVKKIIEDPDNNFRVLVELPSFTGTGQDIGLWARLAFPYASGEAGFFFFPEIGDEVIVSFINNDPRFPVITGALYNQKNKPKEETDEKNQFKSIYSKSGIYIKFDDEDKILTIETPDKNSFILDDKNKTISVTDMNKNTLTMDDSGMSLNSPKDIKLTAKGNIEISGDGGVDIKSNGDIGIKGMNVQAEANTGFTAKGNASAEVSASGQTTIKGAMVMIN